MKRYLTPVAYGSCPSNVAASRKVSVSNNDDVA